MSKYEKWLGAGIGYAVGGPVGGFFGMLVGSSFNNNVKSKNDFTANTSEFETNILVLAAEVIKADGRISLDEISFVEHFFATHFDSPYLKEKISILHHCLQKEYNLRKACDELRMNCSHKTRAQIIHFLFDVAISDRALAKVESDLIFKISGWLNINDVEFRKIKNDYSAEGITLYHLLQVKMTATNDEIKSAYRKLTLQYHPDKTAQLSEAEQTLATQKWLKIQEAFMQIKKERGMD